VARTIGDPLAFAPVLRRELAALDPAQPISDVASMDERAASSVAQFKLNSIIVTLFAAVALVLASVGIFAVISYAVAQRTREIGIRMALGALGSQIASRVLLEAAVLVGIGLVLGAGAAVWLGRFVQNQLYGVKPTDAPTVAIAAVSLVLVAGIATLLPARRASTISPTMALRDQ
jgi:putative ABC transport system permease protein